MKYKPENDGVDHINVYSKGQTELGRLLSNFADTPFELEGKGKFRTVEGFWYWTMTGLEALRTLSEWECKELGRNARNNRTHPTQTELLEAYMAKLKAHPQLKQILRDNKLPLVHYYVYNDRVIEPTEWQWTAQLWEKLK